MVLWRFDPYRFVVCTFFYSLVSCSVGRLVSRSVYTSQKRKKKHNNSASKNLANMLTDMQILWWHSTSKYIHTCIFCVVPAFKVRSVCVCVCMFANVRLQKNSGIKHTHTWSVFSPFHSFFNGLVSSHFCSLSLSLSLSLHLTVFSIDFVVMPSTAYHIRFHQIHLKHTCFVN